MSELTPKFVFEDTTTKFPNSTTLFEDVKGLHIGDIFMEISSSHRDNTPIVNNGSTWSEHCTDAYEDYCWTDENGLMQGIGGNSNGV